MPEDFCNFGFTTASRRGMDYQVYKALFSRDGIAASQVIPHEQDCYFSSRSSQVRYRRVCEGERAVSPALPQIKCDPP
jgi:hypothetical protein